MIVSYCRITIFSGVFLVGLSLLCVGFAAPVQAQEVVFTEPDPSEPDKPPTGEGFAFDDVIVSSSNSLLPTPALRKDFAFFGATFLMGHILFGQPSSHQRSTPLFETTAPGDPQVQFVTNQTLITVSDAPYVGKPFHLSLPPKEGTLSGPPVAPVPEPVGAIMGGLLAASLTGGLIVGRCKSLKRGQCAAI